ncbi:FtsX-like permease family protein [Actinoplanes sp. NPDC023801]|uniref:FtsX-like permease family protein n=1 Tax=Actinoplanes sp. NPDC023801 TaxID=3154595 RepID=UPI0033E964F1
MISLVFVMLWHRRGQAVTLALLGLLAVTSAVAAPAYLIAVDRAVALGQIATAAPDELGLVASAVQNERVATEDDTRDPGQNPDQAEQGGLQFGDVAAALVALPGFTYVYSAEYWVIGIDSDAANPGRFVYRQDVCAHLQILTGRCLAAEGDVLLGEHTAQRLNLKAGDAVELRSAVPDPDPRRKVWTPDGKPRRLLIAGTYRPTEPSAGFWGARGYFTATPETGPGEPIFTAAVTQQTMDHGRITLAMDGRAGPAALHPDRLDQLRADLRKLNQTTADVGMAVQIDTGMTALLDRIDIGQSSTRLLVPVLAVPLILLACFTIFLTVGYGLEGRQNELAVVALRGSRWWTRWWLAAGESLVAVLAGALCGCLIGQLLVNAIAAIVFPDGGIPSGWSSLRHAPLAAGAALLSVMAAQRRQFVGSVAGLLRRHPSTANSRWAIAADALAVLLAVVASVQLVLSKGSLTGVGLFAPAVLMLALGLLAARALLPLISRYAIRALHRGRLGVALAGLQLARRPGAGRLFALLVATVAVAGYATCAVDTAASGRAVEATLGIGADRVLTVQTAQPQQLLAAVRRIDPDGDFAMAVIRLPPGSSAAAAPGLAVDSTRLAAVAAWPGDGPGPAEVASRVRPELPAPPEFPGPDIAVDVSASGLVPGTKGLRLQVSVSSLNGIGDAVIELGELQNRPVTYQQRIAVCQEGCRIDGIGLARTGSSRITAEVVLHGVRATGPDREVLPPTRLADPDSWRASPEVRLAQAPNGLRLDFDESVSVSPLVWIKPASTPDPIPVVVAGGRLADDVISGLDAKPMLVTNAGTLPVVPQLGRRAVVVDLEYADRMTMNAGLGNAPQIWLNAAAPPDILDRVSAQGLTVIADVHSDQVRRRLEQQGPALALWFHVLTGALAVLLGAGALVLAAAVDRRRRVEDLSVLRNQGLRPGPAGQAMLWTYPALVAVAVVIGLLVGAIAWLVTGWALPLAGPYPPDLPLPGWPRVTVLLAVGAVVLLVLTAVAVATGRNLRRRVMRRGTL